MEEQTLWKNKDERHGSELKWNDVVPLGKLGNHIHIYEDLANHIYTLIYHYISLICHKEPNVHVNNYNENHKNYL